MAIETELKLRIAPEHMARLKRHPFFRSLSGERAKNQKLYSVYFDTPDLQLHHDRMALRLRRVGTQWIQTLKGGGGVQAGLHQRNEWETPVASEHLDFSALENIGATHLSPGLHKEIQPLFVTDFSRYIRAVKFEGALIEICLDSGEIRAEKLMRPISELELELKSGDPLQLFKLALVLLEIVPLEVEYTSKAEYGYLLHSGTKPAIRKTSLPCLANSQDIASALQNVIASCLMHLQANVPGTIQKLDEEYLHQVRVAMRQLRVALSIAESFRADDVLAKLKEQVAQLCVVLGRLREWDVFVTQIILPLRSHLPEQDWLQLCNTCEKLRGEQHASLEIRLQSQDYQRILLRIGAWMHGDFWQAQPADGITLLHFAAQILDKRYRQVVKREKDIALADPTKLHMLRIACKKLRYCTEIFASLFDSGKVKRHLSAITALQDILGALNDISVAERLLEELDTGVQQKSIFLVHNWIRHDYVEQIAQLGKAWNKFSTQKIFWQQKEK